MDHNYVAEVKAALARKGQSLDPKTVITLRELPAPGEPVGNVVVLERVQEGRQPDYCVHGYATCVRCANLCWLGHFTARVVECNEAFPLCIECALVVIPPDHAPARHLRDHRRADGPHE